MEKGSFGFMKTHHDAIIPTKATDSSAGYDLYALEEKTIVGGQGFVIVPTGIAVKLPPTVVLSSKYSEASVTLSSYARIAPRSGLTFKEHLTVGAGVVDRDYFPNAIGVLIACVKQGHTYTIKKGERCAQLIIEMTQDMSRELSKDMSIEFGKDMSKDLPASTHAGFGSTGKN